MDESPGKLQARLPSPPEPVYDDGWDDEGDGNHRALALLAEDRRAQNGDLRDNTQDTQIVIENEGEENLAYGHLIDQNNS